MAKGDTPDVRVSSALIVAVVGLLIPAILVMFLAVRSWQPNDIATIVGLFTGVVGTLVGAFLGVQVGAAGKEKAEDKAAKAQDLAERALGALSRETAAEVIQSSRQR